MANSKRKNHHYKMVKQILPQTAEKLEGEGVISAWDSKAQFRIQIGSLDPIIIKPDLVVHLPDKKKERKVLVEVVNPIKPKRFVGELIYPHFLGYFKEIEAAIFLVLPRKVQLLDRSKVQELTLDLFLEKQIAYIATPLRNPEDREETYYILYDHLTDYQSLGSFDYSH